MMNPWEDMEIGPNVPDGIYAIVECLKSERGKYEYGKDIPGVVLDRVLHSNAHYPPGYSFIPRMYYDDEGPFDALVPIEDQTLPGCVIKTHPAVLMKMDNDGEQDDKVTIIPIEDPRYNHVEDFDDVPQQTFDRIDELFVTYKNLEADKEVETLDREDKQVAKDIIEHVMGLYEKNFA